MSDGCLRVIADVVTNAAGWSVRLHSPADAQWSWPVQDQPPHQIRVSTHEGRRLPLPEEGWCLGVPSDESDHDLCCQATAASVAYAVDALCHRAARRGGAPLGRMLFAALFGESGAGWDAVNDLTDRYPDKLIELALRWGPDEHDLSRLPWELLHDDRRFLATSFGGTAVAITRVLAGTHGQSTPLTTPPRILFVIGTNVNDKRVRPGAEMVGLLRAIQESDIRIHHRVLQNATPNRLRAAVETFRPDVVHVISHGGSGPHGSYLVLESDDRADGTEEQRYAKQFAEQLTIDGLKPPVVVLSACETGYLQLQLPGAAVVAPFAVDLVAAGVPVVVAMAGMITDRACRLFTRMFGWAIATGASITGATAKARRLAFADETPVALDWSLPAVFLADDDEPLAIRREDDRARLERSWITKYGGELNPVFCGREEIISAFLALLPRADGARTTGWESGHGGARKSVLAICTDETASGVGKSRLLKEMARQALLDGHIPVLVGTGGDRPAPTTLGELCAEVGRAIFIARDALGIEDIQAQTELLAHYLRGGAPAAGGQYASDLDRNVSRYLDLQMPQRAVRQALTRDLAELADEARQTYPHLAASGARAVLMVDNLGRASEPVLADLIDPILNEFGLGEDGVIPVVLMVLVGHEPDVRQDLRQGQRSDKPWLQVKELAPFDRASSEDLLAYEQVMLHPFLGDMDVGITDVAWAFNRDIAEDKRAELADGWHKLMRGLPFNFTQVTFPGMIRMSKVGDFVVRADDSELLRGGP